MKISIVPALILVLIALTGCAAPPKQLTRDEWINATTRAYPGASKEQVLAASEKLLRLADGNDFDIRHTESGITATRAWTAYAVIVAVSGTDYWDIRTDQIGDGVKVSVQVSTQTQSTGPMQMGSTWMPVNSTTPGTPAYGVAIYDVFFSRLDYLLGKSGKWMTCKEADERVKTNATWGNNEALCNSFNVTDAHP